MLAVQEQQVIHILDRLQLLLQMYYVLQLLGLTLPLHRHYQLREARRYNGPAPVVQVAATRHVRQQEMQLQSTAPAASQLHQEQVLRQLLVGIQYIHTRVARTLLVAQILLVLQHYVQLEPHQLIKLYRPQPAQQLLGVAPAQEEEQLLLVRPQGRLRQL